MSCKAILFCKGEIVLDTVKISAGNTKMIAHRGVSGLECENTAAAFVAAGNRSYFGIETDVHRTADGKYVIIHDDDTGRIAESKLSVEESSFEALRALRLRDRFGRKREDLCLPSLNEYLRICASYEKNCVLELKNPFEKADIKNIFDIVKQEYLPERLIFISFDYNNLIHLRKLSDDLSLQFLCGCKVDGRLIEKLRRYNLDLDIEHSFLSKQNILLLHRNGIKVNCWTVDDKRRAEELAGWNVDYITTNILEASKQ